MTNHQLNSPVPIFTTGVSILDPDFTEKTSIAEMKALGRKKIIEMAKEIALETGSKMVPSGDQGVKVFAGTDFIKVVLAKGYRAYDDDGTRRIETMSLVVHFYDHGSSITHEGDDIFTEKDRETLEFILKKMPSNYEFASITIIDNPKGDPDNYNVQISSEHTMGSHTVNRKTGEWTYMGHKHYARRPDEELMEIKE
jgi:hypothetical protein